MARPLLIDDQELIARLADMFRAFGYEGASISNLALATGLQKASLYHRFPGGKEQMAREVLGTADRWLETAVLEPLKSNRPPAERVKILVQNLEKFYHGGRKSCLLNMLSPAHAATDNPFKVHIKHAFDRMIAALAGVAQDAGHNRKEARVRAERVVALIQGSLVMCRSMDSTHAFKTAMKSIPRELLNAS